MSDLVSANAPVAENPRATKIQTWADAINPYHPEKLVSRDGLEPIVIVESDLKKRSAQAFFVLFVIFMGWAFLAPLDAGVHVSGTVVVLGHRKAIQHPAGGVVKEILVHEGSKVNEGDTLIRINPLNIEAELNSAELDYLNALGEESRLSAEREMSSAIAWLSEMDELEAKDKVEAAKVLQTRLFESRRADLAGRQNITNEQIVGFEAQIAELQNILKERRHQLSLVAEDAKNNNQLASEGFVPQSRANEIERQRSDIVASIANTSSDINRARSSIASAKLQLSQERAGYLKEVDTLLKEAQKQRKTFEAKVDALRFSLGLADLKAPVTGTVVGLKVFTVGGVIQGGQVLMEIVPQEERLIVSAKIPPNLIDKVHNGMEADLRFTAFNMTTTPIIQGKVTLVGADRIPKSSTDDANDPHEYYLCRISTTNEGMRQLGNKTVLPGMPVDVVIKTGERTFASYLIKPILDRLAISFKED